MEIAKGIKRFYRDEVKNDRFNINGIGIYEEMPSCIVNRPDGTGDCLLMLFHSECIAMLNGEVVVISPGSMVYWEQSGHYYGNAEKKWRHSWIHFDGIDALDIIRRAGISPGRITQPAEDLFSLHLNSLLHEKSRLEPDFFILKDYFEILVREAVRSDPGYSKNSDIPERMLEVRNYIDANYRKHLTLDRLAKQFSISRPHLSAEFKRWFGISPGIYFIEQRLSEAEVLLQDHNMQVAEVAERVGWNDVCHFTKLFKKHRGKTPSAVRTRR